MSIEISHLWDRIAEAFIEAYGTDEAIKIKEILGFKSVQAVYRWKDGEVPGLESFIKIADSTNSSIHWLVTGQGKRTVRADKEAHIKNDEFSVYFGEAEVEKINALAQAGGHSFNEEVRDLVIEALIGRGLLTDQVEAADLIFFGEQLPRLVPVKLLGNIAAGEPIEVFDFEESVLVAEDFIVSGRNTFVLKVKGDSMVDEGIFDGDLIICYESPDAFPGQTVVALVDGDKATVKKFYRERGKIRLQPANPRHKPIVIEPHRVKIQGIVIGIQRRP